MGDVDVRKVWSMSGSITNWAPNIKPEEDYAVYEIKKDGKIYRVSFSAYGGGVTDIEKEVCSVVDEGYSNSQDEGAIGFTIDPYKAAEKMLAEHYGYAKMVKAHYEWQAGVIY